MMTSQWLRFTIYTSDFLPVCIIGASSIEVVGLRVDLGGGSGGGGHALGLIWALVKGGVDLWLLKALAVVRSRCCNWLHWHLRTVKSYQSGQTLPKNLQSCLSGERNVLTTALDSALEFGVFVYPGFQTVVKHGTTIKFLNSHCNLC